MDTGEIVKDEKVQQYTTFGLEKTLMTKTDIGIIKEKSNANSKKSSLILLGFKDHGAIPLHHTLDKSYFAYPNDEMISGSLAAFSALHSSMVRKKVIGLGELLTKKMLRQDWSQLFRKRKFESTIVLRPMIQLPEQSKSCHPASS